MSAGAFAVSVNLGDVERMLDDVASSCEAAARPAAQAGAQVLYDDVKRNVGRLKKHTGKLDRAIYQAYSADQSDPRRAVYHVSWNARKAPHGHLVEFGHLQRYEITFDRNTGRFITHKDRPLAAPRQVAAQPFIRPAMARFEQAITAARERFLADLQSKGVGTA